MTGIPTIIAGSRTITDRELVFDWIDRCPWEISLVLHGYCCGVDMLGEAWAEANRVPFERFPANWSIGRSAGPIRNSEMVKYAQGLIVVATPGSRGSLDILRKARKAGLQIHAMEVGGEH